MPSQVAQVADPFAQQREIAAEGGTQQPGRRAGAGPGAASSTPTTFAPSWWSWTENARINGPLPAIRIRSPGYTFWILTIDWAPPAVSTPGSVQPGNGTGRSYAPVARTRCSVRIVLAWPSAGPVPGR